MLDKRARQESLKKVFDLRERDQLTFGQIARRLGMDRSTACRMYQEQSNNERKRKTRRKDF